MSLCSQNYRFGIRDPEKTIPDPGSRGQKGTGSRIRIRNTAFHSDADPDPASQIDRAVFPEEKTESGSKESIPDLQ